MSSDEEEVSGEEYESVEEEEEEEEEVEEVPVVVVKKKKRKGKKKKDPLKPKRNMSAFFLYSNAFRSEVKVKNPDVTFGEVAKILSAQFKQLPEKELKKWQKKADKDKLRYQEEMKDYVAPEDSSDDEGPKKKKKKEKDPNRPKRNMSAFFLFSNANRAEVKTNNPEASFGDIAKLISKEFKALTEKDRKKWDKKAAKDKERYQEDMVRYNATLA
eukprot:CAMPEP_0198303466 /NCGR_PEP_ID=MMETSP1449-20131203/56897_1 /TAXON_ID=420275 /ORGANISM="Attheya septentrionalis, Strain CCMP2084" /LENGTH=214 /DNA_ID=CAMNT_0044005959 /DNA_START=1144 /DNA_END=1788 /DNA_ORIENTATION=+